MNNLDAVIAVVMVFGSGLGGFIGGKRASRSGALLEATQTMGLMREEIETLKSQLHSRETELAELRGRLVTMEDLVTQRADVDGVRQIVERIASQVFNGDA